MLNNWLTLLLKTWPFILESHCTWALASHRQGCLPCFIAVGRGASFFLLRTESTCSVGESGNLRLPCPEPFPPPHQRPRPPLLSLLWLPTLLFIYDSSRLLRSRWAYKGLQVCLLCLGVNKFNSDGYFFPQSKWDLKVNPYLSFWNPPDWGLNHSILID